MECALPLACLFLLQDCLPASSLEAVFCVLFSRLCCSMRLPFLASLLYRNNSSPVRPIFSSQHFVPSVEIVGRINHSRGLCCCSWHNASVHGTACLLTLSADVYATTQKLW